jgi:ribonuclease HI
MEGSGLAGRRRDRGRTAPRGVRPSAPVPWVKALLRGQKVHARADDAGRLEAEAGLVEVRYSPKDGRRYSARAQNLEVFDATPLPDDTCGPAEAVQKPAKTDAKGTKAAAGGRRPKAAAGPAPTTPPDGAAIAYADGACSGNPGPAGLGVVVLDGEQRVEVSEYLGVGTNNIAELTAVLRALEEVDAARPLVVYTDSQYTIGVLQKGWKAKANAELIAELREELSGRDATRLAYVPGHSGVPLNERADQLAREAVEQRKTRRAVLGKSG